MTTARRPECRVANCGPAAGDSASGGRARRPGAPHQFAPRARGLAARWTPGCRARRGPMPLLRHTLVNSYDEHEEI